MACLSAMQKCIRRGMERDAMLFACELLHTSKAFHTMVCNRLEVIAHEDIDVIANPAIVPFVRAACAQARDWYDANKIGKSRMPIGNAIRLMCRAAKCRQGDHFHAAVGLSNLLEHAAPEIPDWAYDQHTAQGRRRGRGLDYFRQESTKLVPAPTDADPYEDDAYRLWALKRQREADAPESPESPAPAQRKARRSRARAGKTGDLLG
jgi:replication-associated recombination protein RarA